MPETRKTKSANLSDAPTGVTGAITAQDYRDLIESIYPEQKTRDSAATDDSSLGYDVGHDWCNTSASPRKYFVCTDNSVGAAVWLEVATGSGGGGGDNELSLVKHVNPGASLVLDLDNNDSFYISLDQNCSIDFSYTGLTETTVKTWMIFIVTNGFTPTWSDRWDPDNESITYDTGTEVVNILTVEAKKHNGIEFFEIQKARSEEWPVELSQTDLRYVFPFWKSEPDADAGMGGNALNVTLQSTASILGGPLYGIDFDAASSDYATFDGVLFAPTGEWTMYIEIELGATPASDQTVLSMGSNDANLPSVELTVTHKSTGDVELKLIDDAGNVATATNSTPPTGRSRWKVLRDNVAGKIWCSCLTNSTHVSGATTALSGTHSLNYGAFGARRTDLVDQYWDGTIYALVVYGSHITTDSDEELLALEWFDRNRGLS